MRYINVETINGIKKEKVYNVNDFPYDILAGAETISKKNTEYYNIIATFDIETTTIETPKDEKGKYIFSPYGFMYHWQMCVNGVVVFGRYWNEWLVFLNNLKERLLLNEKRRLVCYVHNLAFEFQFFKDFLPIDSIFAKEERKPMKVLSDGIEFRCSYFLSNMSLGKFCENTANVTHYKLVDTYNYRKIRTPKTPLTEEEQAYCFNDVMGLYECISTLLKEDTIISIPLTNTGYVRREYRKVMNGKKNRAQFIKTRLYPEQYEMLKKAFRGGNTHANRYLAGLTLENVYSCDLESSYPASINLAEYPIGKFTDVTLDTQEKLDYYTKNFCVVMEIEFFDIVAKDDNVIPYIPIAKCEKTNDIINDNGRILQAHYLKMTITNIDLDIIRETYDYKGLYVIKAMYSKRGKLPIELREKMMMFYNEKTKLKGIENKEYEYLKSKNRLNSTFGMMVSDIAHSLITFIDNEWGEEKPDLEKALNDFYNSRNSFLSYQWGVFVTANSRRLLQDMLNVVKMDVVYVDTDSIKFINKYHIKEFQLKNRELVKKAIENDVPAVAYDSKGHKHFMGIWDITDGAYSKFKTLGAKKYCYNKMKDNSFHITVSGMGKEKGAKAVGSCENFIIGKCYTNIGRTTSWYNDSPITEIEVNGEKFLSGSNIGVLDTTYTLGVTKEYWDIIGKHLKLGIDKI